MLNVYTSCKDEFSKIAWSGTYYHGTTPEAEKKILREGLRASMGGKGKGAWAQAHKSWSQRATRMLKAKPGRPHPVTGKVSTSRSKNLARIYGNVLDPTKRKRFREIVVKTRKEHWKSGIPKRVSVSSVPAQTIQTIKSLKNLGGRLLREFTKYEPLQIKGKALKGLTGDSLHPLLGAQSTKDIPAKLISKAKPGMIARFILRRGK